MLNQNYIDDELNKAYACILKAQASIETIGNCIEELELNRPSNNMLLVKYYEKIQSELFSIQTRMKDTLGF